MGQEAGHGLAGFSSGARPGKVGSRARSGCGQEAFLCSRRSHAAVSSKAAPEREAKTSLLKKMVFSSAVKEAALRHLSGV